MAPRLGTKLVADPVLVEVFPLSITLGHLSATLTLTDGGIELAARQ